MIEIIHETDDPVRREIVDRYYDMDDRGRFLEDVTEIGADYGMTWKQVVSVVRSSSTVLSNIHRCDVCGKQKEFTSRSDIRRNRAMDTYLCSRDCREEKRQREKKSSQAGQEILSGAQGASKDRLLRKRVGRVTEALAGVTEQLSTLSSELQGIKSYLKREHEAGEEVEEAL